MRKKSLHSFLGYNEHFLNFQSFASYYDYMNSMGKDVIVSVVGLGEGGKVRVNGYSGVYGIVKNGKFGKNEETNVLVRSVDEKSRTIIFDEVA
jgi:hypothetical protein